MAANSFETDGRGPSEKLLLGTGLAMIAVAALVTGLMMLKSTGRLNDFIPVVADLNNVGDGIEFNEPNCLAADSGCAQSAGESSNSP
jgi:hypothetical protein